MAQIINTNLASLNAQRNLNSSQSSLQTALQRLSSGLRINSAKDDAAGLGIADRFNSQIRGLNQATRNANDGISLAQTAEGALGTVGDNLQRLRELAVQSANATNTSVDRNALQAEVNQLVAEIDRVASTTQFNGVNLLDGRFSGATFQVGANVGQTISVTVNSARASVLGTGTQSAVTGVGDDTAMATGDVIINGVTIGGSTAADDASSSTMAASSAIAKAAAINRYSAQTGVTASVNENTAAGAAMTAAAATGSITINGVTTGSISTTTDLSVTRQSVVAGINAISDRTGVIAVDTGDDNSGVKLVAKDGRNIAVSFTTITSASTGVTASAVTYGSYSLTSSKTISITEGTGTITNTGLRAGDYAAQQAYVTAKDAGTTTALASGDVKINGVLIGASLTSYDTASSTLNSASAIAKAAAINKATAQTGVTATAKNELSGSSMTAASAAGTITINGVTTDSFSTVSDTAKDRAATVKAINAISGRTGVVAIDGGSDSLGVKLVAADGRNITLNFTTLTAASTGVSAAGTYVGRVTLSSAGAINVDRGTTATGTTNLGIDAGVYGNGKSGQALSRVDISTVEGANAAITAIDNALAQVNSARGDLGAVQNRFNATVSNLQTTAENLTASRSRIVDADFAAETANLTRAQILQQAGVAMLAQANSLPQQVLTLLQR